MTVYVSHSDEARAKTYWIYNSSSELVN